MRIEDYGLIGDMQAAALIGRDGSVDWLCLPRLDSPSSFSAVLGDETHGQFLACSFWLLGALALNGRVEEAGRLFDRLLGLTNDLGLRSEQYDVSRQRQVGNFSQAFIHLTLLGAARAISEARGGVDRVPG